MAKVSLYLGFNDGEKVSFIKRGVELEFLPPIGASVILEPFHYFGKIKVTNICMMLSEEDKYYSSSDQFWIYLNASTDEDTRLYREDRQQSSLIALMIKNGWEDRRTG